MTFILVCSAPTFSHYQALKLTAKWTCMPENLTGFSYSPSPTKIDRSLRCRTHAHGHHGVSSIILSRPSQAALTELPTGGVFRFIYHLFLCFSFSLIYLSVYLSNVSSSSSVYHLLQRNWTTNRKRNEPFCTYFPASIRINLWPLPPFPYYFEENTWP